MLKKFLSLIICFAMLVCPLCFVGCESKDNVQVNQGIEYKEIGQGENQFYFICVDADKNIAGFDVHTDKKTVGEALLELEIISGDDGPYGLYVKYVNGIRADYDLDGKYWAFYVNDEYAVSGVDTTEIQNGQTYSFRME